LKSRKKSTIGRLFVILAVFLSAVFILYNAGRSLYPLKYEDLVEKYSKRYDLDPFLVMAVIKVESSFRYNAVSQKNARGLMQITEGTGRWGADKLGMKDYSAEMLFEPEANIHIGCWYLNSLYRQFGDTDLVLAAYNAGSGNVSKWLSDKDLSSDGRVLDRIPFRETERYIKKVKNSYIIYKKLYENKF
jgi:soluble lytic murein transglycosylase